MTYKEVLQGGGMIKQALSRVTKQIYKALAKRDYKFAQKLFDIRRANRVRQKGVWSLPKQKTIWQRAGQLTGQLPIDRTLIYTSKKPSVFRKDYKLGNPLWGSMYPQVALDYLGRAKNEGYKTWTDRTLYRLRRQLLRHEGKQIVPTQDYGPGDRSGRLKLWANNRKGIFDTHADTNPKYAKDRRYQVVFDNTSKGNSVWDLIKDKLVPLKPRATHPGEERWMRFINPKRKILATPIHKALQEGKLSQTPLGITQDVADDPQKVKRLIQQLATKWTF